MKVGDQVWMREYGGIYAATITKISDKGNFQIEGSDNNWFCPNNISSCVLRVNENHHLILDPVKARDLPLVPVANAPLGTYEANHRTEGLLEAIFQ